MLRNLSLLAVGIGIVLANGNSAQAQVAISIGEPPVCPYGYYEVPPYNCAPDGYYGPEWFSGGIFIGAGPWYHGSGHFYGHVDHRLFDGHGGHLGQLRADHCRLKATKDSPEVFADQMAHWQQERFLIPQSRPGRVAKASSPRSGKKVCGATRDS